jgi:hypothetical protein
MHEVPPGIGSPRTERMHEYSLDVISDEEDDKRRRAMSISAKEEKSTRRL